MPHFIPCPGCEQHVKTSETNCPHCGARLRDTAGKLRRTATAAVLGLAAATAATSCDETVSEYGPAPTTTNAATTTGAGGGTGGDAGATNTGGGTAGMGGEPVAEYGPAPSVGGGPGVGGSGGAGGAGGN